MIIFPNSEREWRLLTEFLHEYALVKPTPDLRVIGWASDGKLVIVVGLQGFVGSVCQIHVAYAPGWHYSPRAILREVFHYAFVTAERQMLIGVVNSQNTKAMRMDLHLGFREFYRLPGMHDNGGDLVLLGLKKENCRWLDEPVRQGEQHDLVTVH